MKPYKARVEEFMAARNIQWMQLVSGNRQNQQTQPDVHVHRGAHGRWKENPALQDLVSQGYRDKRHLEGMALCYVQLNDYERRNLRPRGRLRSTLLECAHETQLVYF